MKNVKSLSYMCLPLLMLLLAACSGVGISQGSGTTGSKDSQNVLQVLQKSAVAMKNLKSAHIEMQSSAGVQMTHTDSKTPSNISFTIAAKGDEMLPDQSKLNLTLVGSGAASNEGINIITQKDKVYVQNPAGKWYVITRNNASKGVNPLSGASSPNTDTLLNVAQNAKLTDHGDENINGQSLRHITATLDRNGLEQLLTTDPSLKQQLGQANINTVLKSVKSFNSSIDLWIDENQYYVHRSILKLTLNVDTSAAQALVTPTPNATPVTLPATVATKISSTVDLSNFNSPVSITVPTNATPTDNILKALM
ncbi:MAG TPA: DUF6612 family protein [Ktedonobacteraceae bacterium]|nr:DUF6612 family protein [Ktedonobacteraceae bacterium]